jgi:serine/threonine-protein kinase
VEIIALKVLNPGLANQPNRLAQFRREAERGTKLAGPWLLQVFEFGALQGYLYMVMPFVEGTTLRQVIKERRAYLAGEEFEQTHRLITMDDDSYLRTVVRIMSRAARALGKIHEGHIVHRDIKPANILLDYHRAHGVYLCDLGLGRDLDVATPEQMRDGAGTPMYMAPERLLKDPADEILCDVYSLGVTLFETLTLDRPFQAPEGMPWASLCAHLARAEPRTPRELNPTLPIDLEFIVLKAMARNPQERHGSALELAGELERFLVRWSFLLRRIPVDETRMIYPGLHSPPTPNHTLARNGTDGFL